MTQTEILQTVSSVVGDVVGIADLELQPAMVATDVEGWDSLAHVTIIVSLEKTFGVRFRVGEIATLKNVGELVGHIASRLHG
jgi:acyl carrier protein